MRVRALAVVCVLAGCRAPLPDPSNEPAAGGGALVVEPPPEAGRIHPVSRFRIIAPPGDDVVLVRGVLGSYHLGKIRDRDLPKTLLERLVPVRHWVAGGEHTLRPTVALERGESYALASAELGLVSELVVRSDPTPVLERLWPPTSVPARADYWLFCGDGGVGSSALEAAWLEPGPHPVLARVEPGTSCVSLDAPVPIAATGSLVPPLGALGASLDPAELVVAEGAASAPIDCAGPEIPLGPGCATVLDDRAVVRTPEAPTLWWLGGDLTVASGGRVVVRGLLPASVQSLSLWVRDPFAELFRGEVTFATAAPLPHVVLNEVFANPNGPEPAAEWVELTNDGSAPVDLATLELRDQGGAIELPEFTLAPGAFVLVARSDFAPAGGPDPTPPGDTVILRVESLGKNGLSNSGEALELVGAGGSVVSRFPALPKPKPGVSVARRAPWTLDDDPAGFGHHASPGASPGRANVVVE